jgi:hypothetical protein
MGSQVIKYAINCRRSVYIQDLVKQHESWIQLRKKETLLAERQTKDAIFGDVLVLQR